MSASTVTRAVCFFMLALAVGCSPLPRKYLREAEPGVTLTQLQNSPREYQNKLVILGGAIVTEERREDRLWLHVKNRPLDVDYAPQLPPSPEDPEGGMYWIVVGNQVPLSNAHHHWADLIVVGRVIGMASEKEPILKMVYVRGRSLQSRHNAVWEDLIDESYLLSPPAGVIRDMSR